MTGLTCIVSYVVFCILSTLVICVLTRHSRYGVELSGVGFVEEKKDAR